MFKKRDSSSRQKMHDCFFQQILQQNASCFLFQHREMLLCRGFVLKSIDTPRFLQKTAPGILKIALYLRD